MTIMNRPSNTALTLLATLSHQYGHKDGWFSVRYRWTEDSVYHGTVLDALEDAGLITVRQGCRIQPTATGMIYARLNAPKPRML